jgi:succinoglycan biosynthesis protein ExoM
MKIKANVQAPDTSANSRIYAADGKHAGSRWLSRVLNWALWGPRSDMRVSPNGSEAKIRVSYVADWTGTERDEVTVCICTFRRASILRALESVSTQELPKNVSVHFLIIDNDDEPSARHVVNGFTLKSGIEVDYIHAPGRNISLARNAALEAVRTRWLAFIDDDERASPSWLAKLWAARTNANIVFGPCEAIYPEETRAWIKTGDYHSNRWPANTGIDTGYTSNVLIDTKFVRRHGLQFDTVLGRTGGEDTMFFNALYRHGGVLAYAHDAVVYEDVVPARINLRWVMTRKYRAGQVYAMMVHGFGDASYRRVSFSAPLKITACLAMSVATMFRPAYAMRWLIRGTFHSGVLSFSLGIKIHEEYRIKD